MEEPTMSQHPATRLGNAVKDDLTPERPTEQAPTPSTDPASPAL
jgi:hypothetical protein